jgi:hypothetical protein
MMLEPLWQGSGNGGECLGLRLMGSEEGGSTSATEHVCSVKPHRPRDFPAGPALAGLAGPAPGPSLGWLGLAGPLTHTARQCFRADIFDRLHAIPLARKTVAKVTLHHSQWRKSHHSGEGHTVAQVTVAKVTQWRNPITVAKVTRAHKLDIECPHVVHKHIWLLTILITRHRHCTSQRPA